MRRRDFFRGLAAAATAGAIPSLALDPAYVRARSMGAVVTRAEWAKLCRFAARLAAAIEMDEGKAIRQLVDACDRRSAIRLDNPGVCIRDYNMATGRVVLALEA